jgi:hypothetical protein
MTKQNKAIAILSLTIICGFAVGVKVYASFKEIIFGNF